MPKAAYRSDFRENTNFFPAARFEPGSSRAAGKRVTTRPLRPAVMGLWRICELALLTSLFGKEFGMKYIRFAVILLMYIYLTLLSPW